MTYLVIRPGAGEAEVREGEPTFEALAEEVGGMVALARASREYQAALWVNDNFAGLALERNVLATVVAIRLSASPTPYAGPMVITQFEHSPEEGITPVSLPPEGALAIEGFVHDAGSLLGLNSESPDRELPRGAVEVLREAADYALHAPFPGMQIVSARCGDDSRR